MATAVEAAQHIFLSPSRFRDLVAQGVFKRKPAGKYVLDEVREAYCLHAQKVMAGRIDEGGKSLSASRARLASAQAARAEMRNAVEVSEFVAVATAARLVETDFRIVRERYAMPPYNNGVDGWKYDDDVPTAPRFNISRCPAQARSDSRCGR